MDSQAQYNLENTNNITLCPSFKKEKKRYKL